MRRLALAAGLTMLCACASQGSSDLGLTSAPPNTAVSTTAVVATTSSTVAPTVPPTDPPATTEPPTTVAATDAPAAAPLSKEDQVKADFETARLARAQCTFDPTTCDYAAIAIPGSPMDVHNRHVVAERTSQNVRGKPGAGDVLVRVESVGFEGGSAYVTVCTYDRAVLFDIADPLNPDDDIVINDNKDSYRVRWELRRSNDAWLLYTNKSIDQLHGGDLCEF